MKLLTNISQSSETKLFCSDIWTAEFIHFITPTLNILFLSSRKWMAESCQSYQPSPCFIPRHSGPLVHALHCQKLGCWDHPIWVSLRMSFPWYREGLATLVSYSGMTICLGMVLPNSMLPLRLSKPCTSLALLLFPPCCSGLERGIGGTKGLSCDHKFR